jgi:hypothetical protein
MATGTTVSPAERTGIKPTRMLSPLYQNVINLFVFLSGEVQVHLCRSLCRNYVLLTITYLAMAECTTLTYTLPIVLQLFPMNLPLAFSVSNLMFVFLCLGQSIYNLSNVWSLIQRHLHHLSFNVTVILWSTIVTLNITPEWYLFLSLWLSIF